MRILINKDHPIKMRSNEIEEYKKSLKLSEFQREVLVGTLLGDGCMETMNHGRTYRLKIEHSFKQKEYVDWKYNVFKKWVLTEPKVKMKKYSGATRMNYGFSTVSHGSLRFYGQQFYRNGKKIIPRFISKIMTPISLAVWFMDDGSIKSAKHKALVIHSQSFTKSDLERIIKILNRKFAVKANLRRRGDGNGFVIYLLSETVEKFKDLVGGYIIPSLKYKLGNVLPKE